MENGLIGESGLIGEWSIPCTHSLKTLNSDLSFQVVLLVYLFLLTVLHTLAKLLQYASYIIAKVKENFTMQYSCHQTEKTISSLAFILLATLISIYLLFEHLGLVI